MKKSKESERKATDDDVLIEHFTVEETQGAAAFMVGLQKPGYTLESIDRKGTKVKVTFRRMKGD